MTEQTFYRWRSEYGGFRIDQARRLKRLELENSRLKRAVADLTLGNQILREASKELFGLSERRTCRVLGHPRSTQRYKPSPVEDEKALIEESVALASQFGRYGYRRITALLRHRGWHVNHKRVERIWRREGLKVPVKQPKRGSLWFNDSSCVRLRPAWKDHVWAYDFMHLRLHDGKEVRLLTVIDEYSRECLAIRAARSIRSADLIEVLAELMVFRGVPDHIRSDNGPELKARAVREWLGRLGARTLYIEPGSPWENGLRVSTGS